MLVQGKPSACGLEIGTWRRSCGKSCSIDVDAVCLGIACEYDCLSGEGTDSWMDDDSRLIATTPDPNGFIWRVRSCGRPADFSHSPAARRGQTGLGDKHRYELHFNRATARSSKCIRWFPFLKFLDGLLMPAVGCANFVWHSGCSNLSGLAWLHLLLAPRTRAKSKPWQKRVAP